MDQQVDEGYDKLELLIANRVSNLPERTFLSSTPGPMIWGHFLFNLEEGRRQHYNCNCCRHFVERVGGVVDGEGRSLLWGEEGVPEFFKKAVGEARKVVEEGSIEGVFLSEDKMFGTPGNASPKGIYWTHLHGVNTHPWPSRVKTAYQRQAEFREDLATLKRAFGDWNEEVVAEAIRVLESDALTSKEKGLGIAQWFLERLKDRRNNSLWVAVASAPAGWAHVRNTAVATLFDDVKAGIGFTEAKRRWEEKMHPWNYQRPTAAVSDGQIAAAEKLVVDLGLEKSFARRYARLDEVKEFLWRRQASIPVEQGSVFGHLKKDSPPIKKMVLPAKRITWHKFAPLLNSAKSVLVQVPHYGQFYGLTSAVHSDAPTLFQWDGPLAWFFYHPSSAAHRWNLSPGWEKVSAVFKSPAWVGRDEPVGSQGRLVLFAVEGARDRNPSGGLALFPETLRSDLYGVRRVVEKHSASGALAGADQGDANGLAFGRSGLHLDVDGQEYILEGWD